MAEIRTIIFPVDFSERSKGAAHYVEALADRFQAEVKLVHVLTPPYHEATSLEVSGPMLADVLVAHETNVKRQLKTFLSEEFRPYRVERVLLDGDPAQRIVEYANGIPGGLIVQTTHGYGVFRRFILGSVAAKVLHDAEIPVLTGVHMEQSPPKINVRTVLAALDLEGGSERTLHWAGMVAKAFNAKLILNHVAPSIEGRTGELFDPSWRDHFSQRATKAIAELQTKTGSAGEVVISYGDISKQVCETAASTSADLLVIGRSHDNPRHGRLRTHAYAIIRTAPCPVLSV